MVGSLISAERADGAEPPSTKQVEQFDDYHGTKVADPYRWLEDDVRNSPEVAAWVKAQNKYTFDYLEQIPEREAIGKRLTELWNYEKYGTPFKAGGRYYFYKNDGLQNQSVLYQQSSLDAEPRVLIDANTWSEDGTEALSGVVFSSDGRYAVYGVQSAGSDWKVWRIMEIATGKTLDDELRWTKFSRPEWAADNSGLFYSRFPALGEDDEFQSLNINEKVYFHKIGQSQDDDVVVFYQPDEPNWRYYSDVTEDGRYLIITAVVGTDDKYQVWVKDFQQPHEMPIHVVQNFHQEYTFVGNDGADLIFKTDLAAPRKRLIAVNVEEARKSTHQAGDPPPFREVIPQQPTAITDMSLVGNLFMVESLQDAKSQVSIYDMRGQKIRDVELPGIGSVYGFEGKRGETETFYSFSSFATPSSTYRYDVITGESTLLHAPEVDFDPSDYEVQQVFFTSKDGTRVPLFITFKKGMERDGSNPTLLYGYGGFNSSSPPSFRVGHLAWMEMGGIYAQASLRGGGEYGEEWHQAGTKLLKQNVFDDFIAAAEYLIAEKYTQPAKLGIEGYSNGGLLVGACLQQRPDLYGACLPGVGVMDMLRFHRFTAGRYWTDDYGCADNPEEFKALLAYSPYHNCKPGVAYPPTFITTADTDDRVVPGHSFKFAAAMQQAQAGEHPILIRIETKAGHGSGKPTSKAIEEYTDQWSFLVHELGVELPNGFAKK